MNDSLSAGQRYLLGGRGRERGTESLTLMIIIWLLQQPDDDNEQSCFYGSRNDYLLNLPFVVAPSLLHRVTACFVFPPLETLATAGWQIKGKKKYQSICVECRLFHTAVFCRTTSQLVTTVACMKKNKCALKFRRHARHTEARRLGRNGQTQHWGQVTCVFPLICHQCVYIVIGAETCTAWVTTDQSAHSSIHSWRISIM